VSTPKHNNGKINCALFDHEEGFPDDTKAIAKMFLPIEGGNNIKCEFKNLKPGVYAVSVYHDENNNGALDKSFVGKPKEGYGVSNDRTHAMSKPKFDDCKFTLEDTKTQTINIPLHY
jgi:uncharacterized protein (DUF2141 family)